MLKTEQKPTIVEQLKQELKITKDAFSAWIKNIPLHKETETWSRRIELQKEQLRDAQITELEQQLKVLQADEQKLNEKLLELRRLEPTLIKQINDNKRTMMQVWSDVSKTVNTERLIRLQIEKVKRGEDNE